MEMKKTFTAGYARRCITPDYQVCITGYGDDERRFSQGVVDNIYLTCLAVTDGEDTVLLYTADLLSLAVATACGILLAKKIVTKRNMR